MRPPAAANTPLQLMVSYEDRSGAKASFRRTVALPAGVAGDGGGLPVAYDSSGVRKAVALARYADMLEDW